jgi:hypothetical protein
LIGTNRVGQYDRQTVRIPAARWVSFGPALTAFRLAHEREQSFIDDAVMEAAVAEVAEL